MKSSCTPSNTQIRPMLAQDIELSQIQGQSIVQPKLDGVRAIWDKNTQCLHTRNGRIITSCDHIIHEIYALNLQHHSLDGEIYNNDLPFETINGLTRKHQPQTDNFKLQFHVFDVINHHPASQRANWLGNIPASQIVKPVATFFAEPADLDFYYQSFLDSDLEGMIIRNPAALYSKGKSPALYRVKPVHDLEATLIGFEPTQSELNKNTFGALRLKLPNGKTFKCAGLSSAQRNQLWRQKPIGASITILYKGLTGNGLPREPRFKAIRYDLKGAAA